MPYLDMLKDKAALSCKTLQKCVAMNETMTKRTPNIAQNAIRLLNIGTNDQLQVLGVKDMITVMMWSRKMVCKHSYANNVKRKAEEMRNSVHQVKNLFQPLFSIGLPTFWDSLGKLVPVVEHQSTLLATRMDSSRFNELPGILLGPTIFDKLSEDFRILHQLRNLREFLPPMFYTQCIELEILLKEMSDYEMLINDQWKHVERLGRSKYNIAGASAS